MVNVNILIVGGGGGGSNGGGGGGGGGGVINNPTFPISTGIYSVTVGTGGAGGAGSLTTGNPGVVGNPSSFPGITTAQGGGGGNAGGGTGLGGNGACGGGADGEAGAGGIGSQGGNGGAGDPSLGGSGGGGGMGGAGQPGSGNNGGDGGPGVSYNITGSSVIYGAGGGGSVDFVGTPGAGGSDVGGAGGGITSIGGTPTPPNYGCGGGGGGYKFGGTAYAGGSGSNGVVIFSYPTGLTVSYTGSYSTLVNGSNTVLVLTTSGNLIVGIPPTAIITNLSNSGNCTATGAYTNLSASGATSDSGGGTLTYNWYYNNSISAPSGTLISTSVTPSFSYAYLLSIAGSTGIHYLWLTVTNSVGSSSAYVATALVVAPTCATNSYSVSPGNTITFACTTTTGYGASIVSYSWVMNSVTIVSTTSPTFPALSYANLLLIAGSTGSHGLTLTVTDNLGQTASANTTINLMAGNPTNPVCPVPAATYPCSTCNLYDNQPPVPIPNGPYSVHKNGSVIFDATGSYNPDGGSLTHYYWSSTVYFVDCSTVMSPAITWTSFRNLGFVPGVYNNVKLAVTSAELFIVGDAGNQTSNWSFSNISYADFGTGWYKWYWTIISVGGTTTVNIYANSTYTTLLSSGSVSTTVGGIVTLAPQTPGILSGHVTLIPNVVTNTNAGNSVYFNQAQSSAVSLTVYAARPPVANTTGPYIVSKAVSATINGTTSSSPDGDPLTYHWVLSHPTIAGGPWDLGTSSTFTLTHDYLHITLGLPHTSNVAIPLADFTLTLTVTAGNTYPGDAVLTNSTTTSVTLLNSNPVPVIA